MTQRTFTPDLNNPKHFVADSEWCRATSFTLHKNKGLIIYYTSINGFNGSYTSGAFPGSETKITALVDALVT